MLSVCNISTNSLIPSRRMPALSLLLCICIHAQLQSEHVQRSASDAKHDTV